MASQRKSNHVPTDFGVPMSLHLSIEDMQPGTVSIEDEFEKSMAVEAGMTRNGVMSQDGNRAATPTSPATATEPTVTITEVPLSGYFTTELDNDIPQTELE